jgi:uncharacterized protein
MSRRANRRSPWIRFMLLFLSLTVLAYVALVALLWWQQDAMVFPGAGRGDRGVPAQQPPAVVTWIGPEARRTRLATVDQPASRAVVLYFGGNGEDLHSCVQQLAQLLPYGVDGLAAEYPGYGASPGRPSVEAFLATADAALAVALAHARRRQLPLVVIGSSLGSFAAVHAATRAGVDRLLLRAPPSRLAASAKHSYPWLPIELLLRHRFDSLAKAAAVPCPVLIVHGDRDDIVPPALGEELARALPQARFVLVPGRGHNDLDLGPGGPVAAEIAAFVLGR